MAGELLVRFLIGGALVSLFSVLGDAFEPKTFAGIFGAAPSVALATLTLAYLSHGSAYVAQESRSMAFGAIALIVYSAAAAWIVRKREVSPWLGAAALWIEWLAVAFAVFRVALA